MKSTSTPHQSWRRDRPTLQAPLAPSERDAEEAQSEQSLATQTPTTPTALARTPPRGPVVNTASTLAACQPAPLGAMDRQGTSPAKDTTTSRHRRRRRCSTCQKEHHQACPPLPPSIPWDCHRGTGSMALVNEQELIICLICLIASRARARSRPMSEARSAPHCTAQPTPQPRLGGIFRAWARRHGRRHDRRPSSSSELQLLRQRPTSLDAPCHVRSAD
ncbi:hypothetical protein IWX90DRAFT_432809 [Phyllosticta citrichinensis]|uniref:Uncharacterized protein n=1 Tax=Phyllosticta citrichinensis TaxID=1130410 RepID=A0ABR1XT96_9PEZI